jgi:hypothetical protein
MSERTVPEHAFVRVSASSAGTLVATWPQDGTRGCGGRCPGRTVTGMLLAADERAPTRWLEAADVIITTDRGEGSRPAEWLRRYPGCAVAAVMTRRDECSVATRGAGLHNVAVSGEDVGVSSLACAVFVYGWLAAGWSLAPLWPRGVHVDRCADARTERGSLLFFRFGYCTSSEAGPCEGTSG